MSSEPLKDVIARKGGPRFIAARLGITRQAVEQWKVVPAERVLQLEKILDVPRSAIRPDLYPIEDDARRAVSHSEALA